MKVVRAICYVLLALVLVLGAVVVLARFRDGPTAILLGGPLVSGELHTGPEPDWTFARDIPEMELQLVEPDTSRTIWLFVVDRKLYAVSGYMNEPIGRLWKHWPMAAEKDGRAFIRVEGIRYERQLRRLFDEATVAALAVEARRKYGREYATDAAATGGRLDLRSHAPRGLNPGRGCAPGRQAPSRVSTASRIDS